MNRAKNLLFFMLFAFLAGVFYWAIFVPKETVSRRIYDTLKKQEKQADLFFKKVSFEEISNGIKYWKLSAATATVNKQGGLATLQNAQGTFFDKGKGALNFRSPAAMWDIKKKEIYLDKPLGYDAGSESKIAKLALKNKDARSIFNLTGLSSYWFQANNLSWKLSDQRLLCTGGILLNKQEVTAYSDVLESDVGLKNVSLSGNPRVLVSTGKSAPITIEARSFEISSPEDLLTAKGNPKVFWNEARIDAEEAFYFQREKKIVFKGKVNLNYSDIQAAGDLASYQIHSQQVLLEGNARAKQGENQLSGKKVLVSLKDKKISLQGKSRVVITEEELKK